MRVVIMNPPGALRSCIAGWQDIFGLANRVLRRGELPALFTCKIWGTTDKAMSRAAALPTPDLVLLPAMLEDDQITAAVNPGLIGQLQAWHQDGVALASACAGSFILAAAGVLDGKAATTHWYLAPRFQRQFPRVRLDIGELIIENLAGSQGKPGSVTCAGGICAYIDLALALIRRHGGEALANQVARTLLWDPHRPRQAAYAQDQIPGTSQVMADEIILKSEAWALARLDQAFTIDDWAQSQAIGLRSFERRFQVAHKLSPGQWLRRQRLLRARELCGTSRRSWGEITAACGYQDPGSLRRHFAAEFGLTPQQYRARFTSQNQ